MPARAAARSLITIDAAMLDGLCPVARESITELPTYLMGAGYS
jgi:hypothetical protein